MKKLIVLSGAGMSAESGISTFRNGGGLWEKYPVEDVATPQGWQRDTNLVLDFYNTRRKELLKVSPNGGHIGLVQLENEYDVRVITQNVDNLHERAGSHCVLHLHGELMKARSTEDEALIYELTMENPVINLGDKCEKGYQLRPHIVWFGEAVPMIEQAMEWVAEADIFVIIGTSLNVYPAASLINYVPKGAPIYLIDPNDVKIAPGQVSAFIRKGATEGINDLIKILRKQ